MLMIHYPKIGGHTAFPSPQSFLERRDAFFSRLRLPRSSEFQFFSFAEFSTSPSLHPSHSSYASHTSHPFTKSNA